MTVAWSSVLSGTSAPGVSCTVSVAVWPMASVIGAAFKPVSVKPVSVLNVRAALAATLPTFSRVTVAVAGRPGTVDTSTGLLTIVTASIDRHGERFGDRLRDGRIGDAGRRHLERKRRAGGGEDGAGDGDQVNSDDARLARRHRVAGRAADKSEAAGDVGEAQVVRIGGGTGVVDDGAEGRGNLGAVIRHGEYGVGIDGERHARLRRCDGDVDSGLGTRFGSLLDCAMIWMG